MTALRAHLAEFLCWLGDQPWVPGALGRWVMRSFCPCDPEPWTDAEGRLMSAKAPPGTGAP